MKCQPPRLQSLSTNRIKQKEKPSANNRTLRGGKLLKLRKLFFNQSPFCKHCQKLVKWHGFQLDHIKPIADGGNDNLENLQILCKSCHEIKSLKENENRQSNPI